MVTIKQAFENFDIKSIQEVLNDKNVQLLADPLIKNYLDDLLLSMRLKESCLRRPVENPNRMVSEYQLLRVIGKGKFGKVYLALLNGQPVALKAIKKTQIIEL